MTTNWLQKYPETSIVNKAHEFAKDAHKDTKRWSGDPYITHCIAVAQTVNDWGLDEPSIAAALLHDVVEDTDYTIKDIEKKFGKEIAFLVDGLTKLKKIQYSDSDDPDTETLKKFILSFSKDLRVVIIKLADRLHNVQTLKFLPADRQKRFAWETIEIYSPLAYRLGMQKLSGELADFAFPHLYPEEHKWLLENVEEEYREREIYSKKIKPIVRKMLEENGINVVTVDSRAKRYSSLYKKLQRYEMDLDKIYDLVALRIIVKSVEECYAALGIIHKAWSPLPGRIKDYMARPKPNGYRSIHTTVFCVGNKITEFQIRTQKMHEEDEFGIAAHWAYQQIKSSKRHAENWAGVQNRKELLWVEQLRNWQEDFTTRKEFTEALKVDFFKDRIFIITPKNDVLDLPAGATPVDFAYHIHSEVGDQCVGAKVNDRIVPLDYNLQSGDIVEVMTQRGKKPSEDWIRFVKTSLAREHIKKRLREGSSIFRKKIKPEEIEFKITNEDRPSYLKEVTAAFAEVKANITYLQSQTDNRKRFSGVTVRLETLSQSKLEKLLVKIKKISGTREVRYKLVS